MVGMLLRWRWKGEKKGGKEEEEISRTDHIPFQATKQHEGKKYNRYTYTHIIQVCYRDTNIPEISTFLPSYLLDITPTLAFNINVTTRSYYTYLHLVLSITIIPYNNTDKPGR